MIEDNYKAVEERVRAAAVRAGRDPEEVTLIAVSKTKPLSDIEALIRTLCESLTELLRRSAKT